MNIDDFQCRCGGCRLVTPNPELVKRVEFLEAWYESESIISSGYRCLRNNTRIGGSKGSKHMYLIAVDFNFEGVTPEKLYHVIDRGWPEQYGVGLYNTHVHFDVRPDKARWDFRK